MDLLVAQHSRPAFEDEGYSEQDQRDLSQITPSLSLKFAMPPIANVSFICSHSHGFDRSEFRMAHNDMVAISISPRRNR